MFEILIRCLDVLFPQEGDALVVDALDLSRPREFLRPLSIPHGSALAHFKHPTVRALIHEAKFHRNKRAIIFLNTLLRIYLETVPPTFDVIVPVPLSTHRLRKRGYNQVEEVLKAHELPIPVATDVLFRMRDTAPQTELSRKERLTNMVKAFSVRDPNSVQEKRILLVDDVTTTGATLTAARSTLLESGASVVYSLALAH